MHTFKVLLQYISLNTLLYKQKLIYFVQTLFLLQFWRCTIFYILETRMETQIETRKKVVRTFGLRGSVRPEFSGKRTRPSASTVEMRKVMPGDGCGLEGREKGNGVILRWALLWSLYACHWTVARWRGRLIPRKYASGSLKEFPNVN